MHSLDVSQQRATGGASPGTMDRPTEAVVRFVDLMHALRRGASSRVRTAQRQLAKLGVRVTLSGELARLEQGGLPS